MIQAHYCCCCWNYNLYDYNENCWCSPQTIVQGEGHNDVWLAGSHLCCLLGYWSSGIGKREAEVGILSFWVINALLDKAYPKPWIYFDIFDPRLSKYLLEGDHEKYNRILDLPQKLVFYCFTIFKYKIITNRVFVWVSNFRPDEWHFYEWCVFLFILQL